MATGPFVDACDLLEGPTLREAKIVVPSGALDLDRLGAVDDPPPGHSQYLRFVQKPMNAVELNRWRGRPDAPAVRRAGPAGPGRALRPPGRCRLRDLAAPAWHASRAGRPPRPRSSTRSPGRAIRARSTTAASSAGTALDRPPLPVLLLHERLALHVLRRERSRGRLGAVSSSSSRTRRTGAEPAWFGAAAHDYSGDDLRRRWDDPRS